MLPLVISSSFCKLVCLFTWESSRSVQRKGKLELKIKHWIKCNFKKKINNRVAFNTFNQFIEFCLNSAC